MAKVLVTGGLGFIGSYICEALLKTGHNVRVIDSLDPQVHGSEPPSYPFVKQVEFLKGDVRDRATWEKGLEGVEAVIHQASAVGVGQSLYQVAHYTEVNVMGTAQLLDYLANKPHSVRKILVAASMSSYGEGRYQCAKCRTVRPRLRTSEDVKKSSWEPRCPTCESKLTPEATLEEDRQCPNSIYALNKMAQEDMLHCFGRAYGIPTVALRYFNVYGPRQSLSNPYTGVLAIFTSRLKNGNPPVIYEDGLQTRDFVHVRDVALANLLALESDKADGESINVGSGIPRKIVDVAKALAEVLGVRIQPEITNRFRKGDVRHCYASISKAKELLKFNTTVPYEEGLSELVKWSESAKAVDKFDTAVDELKKRGLV